MTAVRRWARRAVLHGLLAAGTAAAAAPDCGATLPAAARRQAEAAGWRLAYAPRPWPLAVGRHFSMDVVVCPPAGQPMPAALKVDAEMPAHRHGMNYRASVQTLGDGRFRADGLMFHMPGRWRLHFDLATGSAPSTVRLSQDLDLP